MKRIIQILQSPFEVLSSLRSRIIFAAGMSLFCILFLFIFEPYKIFEWIGYTSPFKSRSMIDLSIIGSFIILCSQLLQALIWRKTKIKVLHLLSGFCLDIVFLTVPLSLLYAAPNTTLFTEIGQTICVVTPIIALWYFIGLNLFIMIENAKKKPKPSHFLMTPIKESLLKIVNENAELRLSLWSKDLLYIEAADNYIIVYFRKGEKISREIIRNTLKNVEQYLRSEGCCIRCHRSFIVNLPAISCLRKSGRLYVVEIKGIEKPIPVSRSHIEMVKTFLQNTNPDALPTHP